MKWITIHEYADLTTGEITKKVEKEIIIIKKVKKHERRNNKLGVTTVTNYYRESKYKQPEIEYPTSRERKS